MEQGETDSSPESKFSIAAGWTTALLMMFVLMMSRLVLQRESPTLAPSRPLWYVVEVNSASMSELRALPDIGASLAQRIVEHREQFGEYRSLEDLKLVRGFGPKTLESLRDQLCVTSSSRESENMAVR